MQLKINPPPPQIIIPKSHLMALLYSPLTFWVREYQIWQHCLALESSAVQAVEDPLFVETCPCAWECLVVLGLTHWGRQASWEVGGVRTVSAEPGWGSPRNRHYPPRSNYLNRGHWHDDPAIGSISEKHWVNFYASWYFLKIQKIF